MSVSFSCTISDELNFALSEALRDTKKKRTEYIKESIAYCLKEQGYIKKNSRLLDLEE